MGKNKALVRVKVFKVFDYPKSMLNKLSFLDDGIRKATIDMQTMLNEIVLNDHAQLDANMFQYEAVEELGYKFRNRQLPEEGERVSLNKAAKVLATQRVEERHGPLNHETNPGLYEHEPEVQDIKGRVMREEAWYMRADIEREFYTEYDIFTQLLKTAK